MKHLILSGVIAAALSGCFVPADSRQDFYEECAITADCRNLDASCEVITADWDDGRSETAGICTAGCRDDFDCPFSNGNDGICVDFDGRALCYESCQTDIDCDLGFRCSDVDGFVGACLPY